jgi:hypothetical protein
LRRRRTRLYAQAVARQHCGIDAVGFLQRSHRDEAGLRLASLMDTVFR